jgi:hypothetical protein
METYFAARILSQPLPTSKENPITACALGEQQNSRGVRGVRGVSWSIVNQAGLEAEVEMASLQSDRSFAII